MQKLLAKIFMWMFIGLFISFGTAYFVSMNPNMIFNLFGGNMWYVIIIEFIVIIFLSARIHKMKEQTAYILFCLYSFLTGITLAAIFIIFEMQSILSIFGFTSLFFLIMCLIGYNTKYDLSKIGNVLAVGLITVIISSIINIVIVNDIVNIAIIAGGLIFFVILVAYDIKMIKKNYEIYGDNNKMVIISALHLYLHFINIFIKLLALFGKRK